MERDTTPDDAAKIPEWWPYGSEFPDWHVWRGVGGVLYARRPRSSPPKVVRGNTPAELRARIRAKEDGQ